MIFKREKKLCVKIASKEMITLPPEVHTSDYNFKTYFKEMFHNFEKVWSALLFVTGKLRLLGIPN